VRPRRHPVTPVDNSSDEIRLAEHVVVLDGQVSNEQFVVEPVAAVADTQGRWSQR
jgi:hypothetical protein